MASALFKLSSDGGSTYADPGVALADSEALTYNASGTYSIKAALDSTAGVGTASWSITSADDVNIASLPTVTQNASDKTCTFSVTKTGGAWLLQCIVNGGINLATGKADPTLTRSLAIKVLNSTGQQEVAVGESTEAGAYGWTKAHNDVARSAGGGGGVIAGAGLTLTGSTLDVVAADSTIQVNANSIQALPANIVTASTVTTALAALSASVSVNSQKITSLGTPTSSTDAATKASSEAAATAAAQNEANLRAAAAALTDTIYFGAVELTDIAAPTSDAGVPYYGLVKEYVQGQITDLVYDQGGTAGGRVYTSLAAAVTAAASISGYVRIWIKVTSGIPTTASGTYALGNRIEIIGLSGGSPGTKTTLQLVTGAVFQNPCAFRNIEFEHDLAAAWITSTTYTSVVFDNVSFNDNGATADIFTLNASSTNYITFDNGSTYTNGGSGALCTLSSGKELYLYVRDGIVSDNAVLGSAGTLRIYQGGSGSIPTQSGFSGTTSADVQDVVRQLGEARTEVDFNDQRLISLADPATAQDAATKNYVDTRGDGYSTKAIGSTSVLLVESEIATGIVEFTGTLSGDTEVKFPAGFTRSLIVVNNTSGTYTFRIAGYGSGKAYLAPRQARRVTQSTLESLIGEALRVVEYETSLDLSSGYTVGNHDVTLFKIPAAFDVDRVEIRCTTGISGGTITLSAGVSGSYNQLIDAQTGIASAGDVAGLDTTFAGADFTDRLAAHYSSAQTITLRIAVATGTLTAGALRVMVTGRYVGE